MRRTALLGQHVTRTRLRRLAIVLTIILIALLCGTAWWAYHRVSPQARLSRMPPAELLAEVARHPGDEVALTVLGRRLLIDNQAGDAADAFRRALAVDPLSIAARSGLACAAGYLGDLESSDRMFRELGPQDPPSADDEFYRGLLENFVGNAAEAVAHLSRAARLRPDDADVWFALARSQSELGLKTDALKSATRARDLWPDRVDIYSAAAEMAHIAGQDRQARTDLEYAVRRWPDQPLPKLLLARILTAQAPSGADEQRRAEQLLQEMLHLAPGFADGRVELGRVSLAMGKPKQALDVLRALPVDVRETGDAGYLLSRAYFQTGDPVEGKRVAERCRRYYERRLKCAQLDVSAKQSPSDPALQLRMARCLADLAQWVPAEREYRAVLRLQPDNNTVRHEMERMISAHITGGANRASSQSR